MRRVWVGFGLVLIASIAMAQQGDWARRSSLLSIRLPAGAWRAKGPRARQALKSMEADLKKVGRRVGAMEFLSWDLHTAAARSSAKKAIRKAASASGLTFDENPSEKLDQGSMSSFVVHDSKKGRNWVGLWVETPDSLVLALAQLEE